MTFSRHLCYRVDDQCQRHHPHKSQPPKVWYDDQRYPLVPIAEGLDVESTTKVKES